MILTALVLFLISAKWLAASNLTSHSARGQTIGYFKKKVECDPNALYPCGSKDTSAVCTAVHGKNVCYCTAPFYVLDEYTGQCESVNVYTDNCSPDQFVCGLDPHARCLITVKGKTCICSPGFVNLGHQCILDPVFVFTQSVKKAATSGGIIAIVLASLSTSWAQNRWCYTDDEIDGLAGFIPHWVYTGDLFSALRCPTLEHFVEEEVFHVQHTESEETIDERENEINSEELEDRSSEEKFEDRSIEDAESGENHDGTYYVGEESRVRRVFQKGKTLLWRALTWFGVDK